MATFTLYLPDELAHRIDVDREVVGESRSGAIRRLIEEGLSKAQRTGLAPRSEKPGVPEAERSPEPDVEAVNGYARTTRPPSAEARLSKPPLQRPIVQKRGK